MYGVWSQPSGPRSLAIIKIRHFLALISMMVNRIQLPSKLVFSNFAEKLDKNKTSLGYVKEPKNVVKLPLAVSVPRVRDDRAI